MRLGKDIQLYPRILYSSLSDDVWDQEVSLSIIKKIESKNDDLIWFLTRRSIYWQIKNVVDDISL